MCSAEPSQPPHKPRHSSSPRTKHAYTSTPGLLRTYRIRVRHHSTAARRPTIHHLPPTPAASASASPSPSASAACPPPRPGEVDLAYHVAGDGPVPVVLVPGMCVSHAMWHNQVRHLVARAAAAGRYTLVLPDLRGTGMSGVDAGHYSLHDLAADVWAVVDAALQQQRLRQKRQHRKHHHHFHHRHYQHHHHHHHHDHHHHRHNSRCSDSGDDGYSYYYESDDDDDESEDEGCSDENRNGMNRADDFCLHRRHRRSGDGGGVHLVGHSMGAMVVQRAALQARLPRRVASLALLGGHDGGWFWRFVPTGPMVRAAVHVLTAGFDRVAMATAFMRLHYSERFLDGVTVCERTGGKRARRDVFLERYLADEEEEEEEEEAEEEEGNDDGCDAPQEDGDGDGDGDRDVQREAAGEAKQRMKVKSTRRECGSGERKDDKAGRSSGSSNNSNNNIKGSGTDKEDPTFWRHLAAARMHGLSGEEARRLRELECPKLAVYGRRDRVVLPRASRELAARIGADVVGVDAAHFLMDEAAGDVNELLEMHLERASAE